MREHEVSYQQQQTRAQRIAVHLDITSVGNPLPFDAITELRALYASNPDEYRKVAKEINKLDRKGGGWDFQINGDGGIGDHITRRGYAPIPVIAERMSWDDVSKLFEYHANEVVRNVGRGQAINETMAAREDAKPLLSEQDKKELSEWLTKNYDKMTDINGVITYGSFMGNIAKMNQDFEFLNGYPCTEKDMQMAEMLAKDYFYVAGKSNWTYDSELTKRDIELLTKPWYHKLIP